MRVSSNQIFQNALNALTDRQSQMSKTQMQLSTGKRVFTPGEDPTAAVQIMDLESSIALTQRYQENIAAAQSQLDLEETAMSSVKDILQRAREIALQANTGLLDNPSRQGLVAEVREQINALADISNTKDSNGDHLYGGYSTRTKPFSLSGTSFSYAGDDGQRYLQIGPSQQVAVGESGTAVFRAIMNGNGTFAVAAAAGNTGTGIIDPGTVTNPAAWVPDTYTITFTSATNYEVRDSASTLITSGTYQSDGAIAFNGIQTAISGTPAAGDQFTVAPSTNQDVFATAQELVTALNTGVTDPASQARLENAINRFLVDSDRALEHFTVLHSQVGARMNLIDGQKNINDDFIILSQGALSEVKDLDYPAAISLFNQQMLALQAAQQAFVRVQNLSLFNYLG